MEKMGRWGWVVGAKNNDNNNFIATSHSICFYKSASLLYIYLSLHILCK